MLARVPCTRHKQIRLTMPFYCTRNSVLDSDLAVDGRQSQTRLRLRIRHVVALVLNLLCNDRLGSLNLAHQSNIRLMVLHDLLLA